MARPILPAERVPTPGPWVARGEAGEGASPVDQVLGIEPATDDRPGGWPYLIRQDRPPTLGGSFLHLATGIQRLADAKLMAAAPELAAVLLRLLTAPALTARDLDSDSLTARDAAWALLVRVAPHLEIDP